MDWWIVGLAVALLVVVAVVAPHPPGRRSTRADRGRWEDDGGEPYPDPDKK